MIAGLTSRDKPAATWNVAVRSSLLDLFAEGFADAGEVVPAVADGVVLDHKLSRDGSAKTEGERRGGV